MSATPLAGRYRLGELLGRGGMSEVYRAQDDVLRRPVAVKVLRASDEGLDEPADEVRLLARLQHPNLVRLFDAGVDAGVRFFVMELVDGRTLTQELGDGPLPAHRVAAIGGQLAGALAYVHDAGVVHRDVKPGNVLVGTDGRARLTDFGIARLAEATRVTPTGYALGTAAYLAPEQVTGEPVGAAADVYALGLLLLECLTGRPEYTGSAVEAAVARLHRPPAVPADLDRSWAELLRELTATDPQRRPSAPEAAERLRLLSDGTLATGAVPVGPVGGALARATSRLGSRRRVLVGAIAAVALAAGAGSAVAALPGSDPSMPTASIGSPVEQATPATPAPASTAETPVPVRPASPDPVSSAPTRGQSSTGSATGGSGTAGGTSRANSSSSDVGRSPNSSTAPNRSGSGSTTVRRSGGPSTGATSTSGPAPTSSARPTGGTTPAPSAGGDSGTSTGGDSSGTGGSGTGGSGETGTGTGTGTGSGTSSGTPSDASDGGADTP